MNSHEQLLVPTVPHSTLNKHDSSSEFADLRFLTYPRIDVCYLVDILGHFSSNTQLSHWHEVLSMLKYLSERTDYGIAYYNRVEVYSSSTSDVAQCEDQFQGIIWCLKDHNGSISWFSKK